MIIGMTVIYLQGAMFFMDTYKPKVFQYVKPSSLGIDTVFWRNMLLPSIGNTLSPLKMKVTGFLKKFMLL